MHSDILSDCLHCLYRVQDLPCGFVESGQFVYKPGSEEGSNCRDPFMNTVRHGPSPCGERCCRADLQGDFQNIGPMPGRNTDRYEFQPTQDACKYAEITRGQILHYLHSRGSSLAVMGDSMMRQLFLRLVMMIRGEKRLLDYHQHTHAQCAVCREADMFRLSTFNSNLTSQEPNDGHLQTKIPSFFRMVSGPGTLMAHEALSACSRAPVQIHYLHSPRFINQAENIPMYLKSLLPGAKPVMLLSVGYWQNGEEVLQDYLNVLDMLTTKARKVFIVSVPTVRVVDPERAGFYRSRNAFMKGWVESKGEPFAFLDYDAISLAQHPPPGGADNNWHYMCSVGWRIACHECPLVRIDHDNGQNEFGEPIPQILHGNIERIMSTEDGMCTDEMNRNLWQVVFNTLIPPHHHNTRS